jgi:DNA polymerase I-like protein with 3'-5' exonuclease and polymerase domains
VLECAEKIAPEISVLLKDTMEEAGRKYVKDLPIVADACIADSWAEK